MLVSAVLHATVLLGWLPVAAVREWIPGIDEPRAVPRNDPIRVLRLPAPARPPALEAPRQALAIARPAVVKSSEPFSRAEPDLIPADRPAARPEIAFRSAPDLEDADASLEGAHSYARPVARTILGDWKAPRSVRGLGVTVRVHVDTVGNPTGLVELVPPTPDATTNREIVYRVRQLEYVAAVRNGRPVAAWAEIALVFCPTSVTATSPAPPPGARPGRCADDP